MGVSRRLSSMVALSVLAHGAVLFWAGGVPVVPDMGEPAARPLVVAIVAPERVAAPATTHGSVPNTVADANTPDRPRRADPVRTATVRQPARPKKPPAPSTQTAAAPARAVRATLEASVNPTADSASPAQQISQAVRRHFQAHFEYPWLARKRNWQGDVVLALHIERDGRLSRVAVDTSSGYAALDKSALRSAQHIGRIPEATRWLGGAACDLTLPVRYRLTDG